MSAHARRVGSVLQRAGHALVVLFVAGCASNPLPPVRARAAWDLRCDASKLTVLPPPGASSYFENDEPFMTEGCGEVGRYVVSYCHGLVGCAVTDAQVVSRLVRRQAAFDLQCDAGSIQIELLGRDSLGARGCGRQASYSLVDCAPPSFGVGGACRVVQSAAQAAASTR
jgi:hypothetical protein